jgi:hypothetical protein
MNNLKVFVTVEGLVVLTIIGLFFFLLGGHIEKAQNPVYDASQQITSEDVVLGCSVDYEITMFNPQTKQIVVYDSTVSKQIYSLIGYQELYKMYNEDIKNFKN